MRASGRIRDKRASGGQDRDRDFSQLQLSQAPCLTQRNRRVRQALDMVAGGAGLDFYFGITSGKPLQPPQEARLGALALERLTLVSDPDELASLVETLRMLARQSGADPDALRALRRARHH